MIIEFITDALSGILKTVLSGISILSLPDNYSGLLSMVTGYGSFIIGSDVLTLFSLTVTFWFTIKLTVGIILFVWKLLPFT